MPDRLRAYLNMGVGVGLFFFSLYMMLYVGSLKKVYTDWEMNPQHGTFAEKRAAAELWPSIEKCHNEHEILWAFAPLFPPYQWLYPKVWATWAFVRVNWLSLVWMILIVASLRWGVLGEELLRLLNQLEHEDRLEELRRKRGRGRTINRASGAGLIEIRNEIEVRVVETGKWWSLNGAVVGGALSTILATIILELVGILH